MSSYTREPLEIFLNSTNIVSGSNNSRLRYVFANGSVNFTNKEICLKSCSVYYSMPAVTSALTFSYEWVDGKSYDVDIPANGTYSASDIQDLIHNTMARNGHTLLNSGEYVYYAFFVENAPRYKLQFNLAPVPAELPTNYSYPWTENAVSTVVSVTTNVLTVTVANSFAPGDKVILHGYANSAAVVNNTVLTVATASGTQFTAPLVTANFTNNTGADQGTIWYSELEADVWALPATPLCPYITIPSNATLESLIGFSPQTFPPSAESQTYSEIGDETPELNPISQVLVQTNIVSNAASSYPGTFFSFPIDVSYGQVLRQQPPTWSYIPCVGTNTNTIEITLTDQLGQPLVILDPEMTFTIQIHDIRPDIDEALEALRGEIRDLITIMRAGFAGQPIPVKDSSSAAPSSSISGAGMLVGRRVRR